MTTAIQIITVSPTPTTVHMAAAIRGIIIMDSRSRQCRVSATYKQMIWDTAGLFWDLWQGLH